MQFNKYKRYSWLLDPNNCYCKLFICWKWIDGFKLLVLIWLKDHHSEQVFPGYNPVILNICFGSASGVAAIVFGAIGDFSKFNRVHYHTLVFLIYGTVQISIPFASHFYMLVAQFSVLGIMDGIMLCFIVSITCDLVKSPKLSNQASGYYHLSMFPMAIAGPAIAAEFYEMYQNYDYSFYIGGCSSLIAAFILIGFILIPDLFRNFQVKPFISIIKKSIYFNIYLKQTTPTKKILASEESALNSLLT